MTAQTGAHAARSPLLDLTFSAADSPRLRLSVEACAVRAGLTEPHRSEFLLAVHEVVGNAIQHGGGAGHLQLHRQNGFLHCRVADSGPGFGDQAIVPKRPDIDTETGRGLWLAHQLTDKVAISTSSEGSVVTMTVVLTSSGRLV
jgi:anti-sigma regulatory factor (Ser/Thr protein kinase)